jgi:hypothetical protein
MSRRGNCSIIDDGRPADLRTMSRDDHVIEDGHPDCYDVDDVMKRSRSACPASVVVTVTMDVLLRRRWQSWRYEGRWKWYYSVCVGDRGWLQEACLKVLVDSSEL